MKPSSLWLVRALGAWVPLWFAGSLRADSLVQQWVLAPDERPYVTVGNNERGIAYNPVSKKVLLLGRAGGPKVWVLDAATGADGSEAGADARFLSPLDANGESPIAGGTFTLNLVGAGADGAVYACNLATSLGTVRIYRWADDQIETPVSVAYSGDPLEGVTTPGTGQDIRFGDNFAVRGSGKDTQLLQTARNGKYILLYTTTDGLEFTPVVFPSPADVTGKIGLGLAFGEGNTIWAKLNGNALQRIELNPATRQARLLGTVATTVVSANITGIGVDPVVKRLAAVDYVAHTLSVFDISDPAGLIRIGDPLSFPASNANANGTGVAAIAGEDVFAVDTNNGLLGAKVEKSVVADPPTISTQPAGATVYAGGSITLAVAVQGTPPFAYAWRFNDTPLPGATGAQLVLTNLAAAQEGAYTVVVSNAAGTITSAIANLVIRAPLATGVLAPAWALNPGDRAYLSTDNTQRGLAYNPATGNLLVVSRSPANAVAVLDAATGAHRHFLRVTDGDELPVFVGGTLLVNMIGVSDDGVVYAANLVTDGTSAGLRLYRWDHDGPDAVPVALPDVPDLAIAERWGDTFDVRGRGAGIQILLGTRGLSPQEGQKFAVLTAPDGVNFGARIFTVAEAPASAFGLGIAFGPGDTVFGTANGQPLVQAGFNLTDGSAALVRSHDPAAVPATVSFLAFDPATKRLAGVALETPDNVRLYDLADAANPVALDQALILPEQPNVNGTGAVDFGGDRVYVLDTNHGLRAYRIQPGGGAGPATLAEARIVGGSFTFSLAGTAGASYLVQRSADLKTWTDLGTHAPPATVSDATGSGPAFYRAVAR